MTKYPLPLEIVRGRFPIITQEYGDKSNVAWYKEHGVDISEHNGTDFVISNGQTATYGTKLVCPVPNTLLDKVWFTHALSTQGNGVRIRWRDERGLIQCLVWHLSETNQQGEYKERDTLGYIGNSGLVTPAPSVWNVYNGAHLHLGTHIDGVLVNPREIFDFDRWYVSETDTGLKKDLPPLIYFLNKIRESLFGL